MRTLARPGATLDVLLDGVPTAEAVRFDVTAGRFELDRWNTQMFTQTDRIGGTLKLDTQPFGYWPTLITIASTASVAFPGNLAVPAGGSIFGDVPGLAYLSLSATTATSYAKGAVVDTAWWSLSPRPSFQPFWPAASLQAMASITGVPFVATLQGDKFAPAGSQAVEIIPHDVGATAPREVLSMVIPSALEPAYRGRHRLFAWVTLNPSQALNMYLTADVGPNASIGALASSAPVASVLPALASLGASGGAFYPGSVCYQLVDLGEIAVPQTPSGIAGLQSIRVWQSRATTGAVATPLMRFGGLSLLPVDGAAGVLPYGMMWPTMTDHKIAGGARWDGVSQYPNVTLYDEAANQPLQDLGGFYRGVSPKVGASTSALTLGAAGRFIGVTPGWPPHHHGLISAAVSLQYRPRFAFLKGI